MDKILVAVFGVLGIVFTFWFFLGKKEKAVEVQDSIDIVVDGGYSPEVVSIPKNKTAKLNFTRKDANSCLEELIMSDFKIKRRLPLNKTVTIELNPEKAGEFTYSCGMNMYHGKIIVK